MLKPTDIQEKEFEIKMRGYDRDQVDDFLDELIRDFTVLYRDNAELTSRLKAANEELAEHRGKAAEVEKSIELARYQCEEMKKNAHIEAKEIIAKAKVDAESVLHGIENNKQKMKSLCTEFLDKINNM